MKLNHPTPEDAFANHSDQVELTVQGKITEILKDDNLGLPHQRFIMTLPSGLTLLVLNNLDRAKELPLEVGQSVEVKGQYRWNRHGGLLHDTHRDHRTGHLDGWILLLDINVSNSFTQTAS